VASIQSLFARRLRPRANSPTSIRRRTSSTNLLLPVSLYRLKPGE
jgi:hypothetical protein